MRYTKYGIPIEETGPMEGMEVNPSDSELVKQYLAKKDEADTNRQRAGVFHGAATIGAAFGGIKPNEDFYGTLREDADRPLKDFQAQQKLKMDDVRFRREGQAADRADVVAQRDADLSSPTSAQSQVYQKSLKAAFPDRFTDEDLKHISAADQPRIDSIMKARELIDARKQAGQLAHETRTAAKREKDETRHKENIDKYSERLGKDIIGTVEMQNAIRNIESKLGGNLDEFEVQGGALTRNGKPADLPGVSVPILGRISAHSGEARDLQSAVAKVFNTELKDRSGGTVTNNEMERIKTEFAAGRFNTEAEMVQALKDYKLLLFQEMKNRESSFDPEVVATRKERGGNVSADFQPSKPKPVAPPKAGQVEDGMMYTGKGHPGDPRNWVEVPNE